MYGLNPDKVKKALSKAQGQPRVPDSCHVPCRQRAKFCSGEAGELDQPGLTTKAAPSAVTLDSQDSESVDVSNENGSAVESDNGNGPVHEAAVKFC